MDIQRIVDAISAQWQNERAATQVTLGELISFLSDAPQDAKVATDTGYIIGPLQSYRGYYSDLSFACGESLPTVSAVLADARAALGAEFTGYKGGEFRMSKATPMWCAPYGCCGRKIVGVQASPEVVNLVTAEDD